MATTKKALASKAKKMGPKSLTVKPEVVPEPVVDPASYLGEKLSRLESLVLLAQANAAGDRSPQSYNAEMDALNKALELLKEIQG